LPRPDRRVHSDRRGRGTAPEGVGLLPLRARDAPHHRRRGRGTVCDPDGGRSGRREEAALPRERGRRPLRRLRSGGDRHTTRRVQRLERRVHSGAGDLAAVTIGERPRHDGPIVLVAYDESWPTRFEREAKRIRAALGVRALLVEHAGSTAVPGLAAKPIIDIVLVVERSADEGSYVPPLEAAGYVLRLREPAWFEHRLFKGPDTNVNLHVFSGGCVEVERMLVFRD